MGVGEFYQNSAVELTNSIQEALFSLKQNKSRSILAGFGVTWGIFILILLLGTGRGFQQGILQVFSAFAKNSIWVYGGQVSESNLKKTSQAKLFSINLPSFQFVLYNKG